MQGIERVLITPDWITILLFFSFLLLVLLKVISSQKFVGQITSITNKGFLEIETEEKNSFFNVFSIIFTLFFLICLSLVAYISIAFIKDEPLVFSNYVYVFTFILTYALVRFLMEIILILFIFYTHLLFSIQNHVL